MKKHTPLQPPEELSDESLLEWWKICGELRALGTLNSSDRAVLTLYCQTFSTWRGAMAHVRRYGAVSKGKRGKRTAHHQVALETGAQLKNLLVELGLTPKSRIETTTKEDKPKALEF